MAKTKAQLEKELAHSEKQYSYYKDHYDSICVAYQAQKEEYWLLNGKYDAFIRNHRDICEAHATQITDAEIQLGHAVEEVKKLRDKVTAQEGRVMVCETAMRSMTIHIAILEQQKGKE